MTDPVQTSDDDIARSEADRAAADPDGCGGTMTRGDRLILTSDHRVKEQRDLSRAAGTIPSAPVIKAASSRAARTRGAVPGAPDRALTSDGRAREATVPLTLDPAADGITRYDGPQSRDAADLGNRGASEDRGRPTEEEEPTTAAALDAMDQDALRELVADIVRQELRGELGETITRNVRKLVRREINRALSAQNML